MTIPPEQRQQAARWALETLRLLGHPSLADVLAIEWNPRFTSRLGDACYDPKGRKTRVRFSIPLWPRASEADRYQTVVHEISHLVTNHEAALDGRMRPSSHGSEWQAVMRRAGVSPDRCHAVDTSDLKKSRRTASASCACTVHAVTPAMVRRLRGGKQYTCRSCKQLLRAGG